jgi:lipoprotein-anchoring transpeptidase ErfK/SrfK
MLVVAAILGAHGMRRGRLVGAALVAGALSTVAGSPAAAATAVPAKQDLAVLDAAKVVRAAPNVRARKIARVRGDRPITGTPTTLPIVAETHDAQGRLWYAVMLPGRPNGRTGWITTAHVEPAVTGWHIVVDRSRRAATIYHLGRVVKRYRVIVGKPSTPTPAGFFFVEEIVREPRSFPGAPYALALSARSTVFSEFAGGPGQVALHGVANLGGRLGTAASHGCVRFSTTADTWLGRHLEAGVPVDVLA